MASPPKTPVTMLSGFLGAGKTTLLRYLLENSKEKIGCVVNDVASINIDAKLVRNDRSRAAGDAAASSTADLADTIELQNGCACCTLQDELFASFEQLLALADKRGEPYARIVLENSGVAEPSNIRDQFAEAAAAGHPLMERIELDGLVTLVDASSFMQDWATRVPLASRPDLGDGGGMRPVVDLLVEQIETSDYVLVNKVDLLPGGTAGAAAQQLVAIVSSLNPLATVIPCQQAQVPLDTVFGRDAHRVVAHLSTESQLRGAVAAAREAQRQEQQQAAAVAQPGGDHHHHHHHDHDHHHDHHHDGEGKEGCKACDHEGHEHHDHHDHHHHDGEHHHHHHHEGDKEGCSACAAGGDHHHHHHHHHGEAAEGAKDACTDPHCSHDHHHHDHEHGHHHHHHKRDNAETTAARRFGIRSFVYCRRRPFHTKRLQETVLRWMPVAHNKALEDGVAPGEGDSPIKAVLRSKGFMWLSNKHATAFYWSHAGQHFEIREEGDWWATVPEEDWPEDPAQRAVILGDFVAGAGDRRQEIVFIGVGMDEAKICEQLDQALLSDEELTVYTQKWASLPDPHHPGAPTSTA